MKKVWRIDYKKLNKENKKQVQKMIQYIQPVMNCMAYNEVMQEIVHKTIELQEQGGCFTQVFGYDVEQYCKDLIKEHPKQGLLEHLVVVMEEISLFILILSILQYIFILISPDEGEMISGIYIYSQLGNLERLGLFGLVGVLGGTSQRKILYKSSGYHITNYLLIGGSIATLDLMFVEHINQGIVQMNMPLVVGLSIGGVLFTYFIRTLVAKWALKK